MESRRSRLLFSKVLLLVAGTLTVSIGVTSFLSIRSHSLTLRQKLTDLALGAANVLAMAASDDLAAADADSLLHLTATVVKEGRVFSSALVTDAGGMVLAHSQPGLEGTRIPDLDPAPAETRMEESIDHAGARVFRVTSPIRVSGQVLGSFQAEAPLAPLEREMGASVQRSLLAGLVLLLVGAIAAYQLARSIARPVERLAQAADEIARGNLAVRSRHRSSDEIGVLASSFDCLADRLAEVNDQLRQHSTSLELKVGERTRQIEEASESLRAQEALLESMTEASGLGFLVAEPQSGRILFFNRRLATIWGTDVLHEALQQGSLPYQNFLLRLIPSRLKDAAAFLESSSPFLELEDRSEHSRELLLRDGRTIFLFSAAVLGENGRSFGRMFLFQDVSDRKKGEIELARARDEALQAARAKSEFLTNMSHELRTPLTAVIGMSDILLETQLAEDQRDFAKIVRNSAQTLFALINDILDFSKIEVGKLDLESIEFHFGQLTEEAVEAVAVQAQEKKLELISIVRPEVPSLVRGDPVRLRQILLNLLNNAVKFTSTGQVVLQVCLVERTEREALLKFEVRDSGIGIPPDVQGRLFQVFSQADASTTRRFGGTGLGLAISKRLTELMGGAIGVESAPGKGSTFWFTARLGATEEAAAAPRPTAAALRGRRVLVVDDHPMFRSALADKLAAWGLSVEAVEDGKGALDAVRGALQRGSPFHILIVDSVIPGLGGLDVIEALEGDPSVSNLGMVLLDVAANRGKRPAEGGRLPVRSLLKPPGDSRLKECLLELLREIKDEPRGGGSPPNDEKIDSEALQTHVESSSGTRFRILIVEDNLLNQNVTSRMLAKLGHAPFVASHGLEALEFLKRNSCDLILMDCQMPEMDGFDTTRAIRKTEEAAHKRTPIVAFTANAMPGDRQRCLEAGMDDYVTKPVKLEVLRATIERYLERS